MPSILDPFLSRVDYVSDGSTLSYAITFAGSKPSSNELPYLNKTDIKVFDITPATETTGEVIVPVSYRWVDDYSIELIEAVPIDKIVRIQRDTFGRYNLTNYNATSQITEADLELSQRQLMFLAQEAADLAKATALLVHTGNDTNVTVTLPPALQLTSTEPTPSAGLLPIFTGVGLEVGAIDKSALGFPITYSTYAEQLADTQLPVDGQLAHVLGYHTAGDGGHIDMVWKATSTLPANEGTIRKPTSVTVGRWITLSPYAVHVRQFGARGTSPYDDTAAIQNAIDNTLGSVLFDAGVYVCTTLTINKRVMFLGTRGTNAGANVWPRIYLKNGTNANLINITTTGVLYADKIDFWGNKLGQTGTSDVIYLAEDTSGSYIGANAMFLTDCVVREGYSKGINCNKNRNGGRLLNTLVLNCNDANFILFGSDWYCNFSEFGLAGGANVYTNFGASNDFVLCDFYYSGQNASYGSSKSNIYVGAEVNALTISSCQINSGYHHGIECEESIASAHYTFTSNQFGANGLGAVNTYSNIKLGTAKAAIKGNVHWNFGQKPKYLIETTGSASRVDFDDVYRTDSYATAVTNDVTKVFNRSDGNGTTLGDGGYYQSRKSGNDRVLRCYNANDVQEQFSIDNQGICRWGAGGSNLTDVALLRNVPNCLEMAADDCFKTGRDTTANRPNVTSVGVGAQFYDTTLSKPIWSDGSSWRDAAGVAV